MLAGGGDSYDDAKRSELVGLELGKVIVDMTVFDSWIIWYPIQITWQVIEPL